jgi:hypothetical protein
MSEIFAVKTFDFLVKLRSVDFLWRGAGFLLSFLESTKSVNVLTCAFKTSISDCEEAEAEAEGFSCFVTITLQLGQNIANYFSSIVDKGQLLQKPEHEIMAKFITGLPNKMAFFVRAGHPTDTQTALTSSKMAEACGYRDHSESVNAIDSARKHKPYQVFYCHF